jgi:hypothetical protein
MFIYNSAITCNDGVVNRLWDAKSLTGECSGSHAVSTTALPNYPIYCATSFPASASASATSSGREMLVAGGSSQTSFIGTLIHSVNVWPSEEC